MTRGHLDHQMRCVLAKLELVSHGSTVSYNAAGGGGDGSSDPLSQNAGKAAAHLFWAQKYGLPFMRPTPSHPGADSDQARAEVIEQANDDLTTITGHGAATAERPRGESAEERDQRICIEGEGYTLKEAAIKFRCGERDVRKARASGGLDPVRGMAPIGALPISERRRRSAELRQNGYSVAAIALLLKVSKPTVKRDLRMSDAA